MKLTPSALALLVALLALPGCTHTDSFSNPSIADLGPFGNGPDIQLTFNADADYWPAWAQDGRGILYAYVDPATPRHRCLGILPAAGGTRFWQLCDNRASRADTLSSYEAFALDSTGRLLVAEAVAPSGGITEQLPTTRLWLADTANPYRRTVLLTLPVTAGSTAITWLADIQWTGQNTFLALGQQFNSVAHCVTIGQGSYVQRCETHDSIFADAGVVVSGSITGSTATLLAISGTDSATGYSLAENGSSIVFTRHHDARLFKVPRTGGVSLPLPVTRTVPDTAALITSELMGVSCKRSTCIVAQDGILLTDTYSVAGYAGPACDAPFCILFAHFSFLPAFFVPGQSVPAKAMELHRISLVSGADEILQSNYTNTVFATPQISPASGDVVVQMGGGWGHLQTFGTAGTVDLFARDGNSGLHLIKGIVP